MYYPKSKIKTGLYTDGAEFVIKSNNKEYSGFYFTTIDNKYFTGKEPSPSSVELIKRGSSEGRILSFTVAKYDITKKSSTSNAQAYPIPVPEKPIPKESDYNNGFIERYFIKKQNGGPETIKETLQQGYQDANKNPLYQAILIKWKLTGPLRDDFSIPTSPIYGIVDTNRRSTQSAEKQMSGISQYLSNLTEFARVTK